MWQAVVIEEESVVELRPFEGCFAKRFDGLIAESVEWKT
jgi:hypothetical protein